MRNEPDVESDGTRLAVQPEPKHVLEILRYAGPRQLLRLVAHCVRDLVTMLLRRPPHLVPIVGPPRSPAAMTAPGAESGFLAIAGPTFRNELRARGSCPSSSTAP